jgi:hypothetical protein
MATTILPWSRRMPVTIHSPSPPFGNIVARLRATVPSRGSFACVSGYNLTQMNRLKLYSNSAIQLFGKTSLCVNTAGLSI